jgi:hypothetical protein
LEIYITNEHYYVLKDVSRSFAFMPIIFLCALCASVVNIIL